MYLFVPLKFASMVQPLVHPSADGSGSEGPFALQFSGMEGYYVPNNPSDPQWQLILPYMMKVSPKSLGPDGGYLPPSTPQPNPNTTPPSMGAVAEAIDIVQSEVVSAEDMATALFEYVIEVPLPHIPMDL